MTLPDIQRTNLLAELRQTEPPVTVRRCARLWVIQIDCSKFLPVALDFDLQTKSINLFGSLLRESWSHSFPDYFNYRFPLEFDDSWLDIKAVFLDGIFSVLVRKMNS